MIMMIIYAGNYDFCKSFVQPLFPQRVLYPTPNDHPPPLTGYGWWSSPITAIVMLVYTHQVRIIVMVMAMMTVLLNMVMVLVILLQPKLEANLVARAI